MLRLFIENNEIELDNEVQFSLNREFENITNPTTIINSWSKTVNIPFTQKNNQIFGHIYNPDRKNGNGSSMGINFNPLKKLNFRLDWGNAIMMQGYAKMNEVRQSEGVGHYQITLFGELGKVFSEMQKITFDKSSSDTNYIIDGSEYVDEVINRNLIYNTWTSTGQTQAALFKKYLYPPGGGSPVLHPAYKVTDIIGFAPNNAYSDGFDYKTYQHTETASEEFVNTLSGNGFTEATGIKPETAIDNGLLPRDIGEYRSYLQLPFIYWNKLFQMFQAKAESVTGYQFELDTDWFNTDNPWWYHLVYMLKPFDIKSGDIYTNTYKGFSTVYYSTTYGTIASWAAGADYSIEKTSSANVLTVLNEQVEDVLVHTSSANRFDFGDRTIMNFHIYLNLIFNVITQGVHIKDNTGLIFTITAKGSNSATKSLTYLIRHSGSTVTYGDATIIETGNSGVDYDYFIVVPTMDAYFSCTSKEFGTSVKFSVTVKWLESGYPWTGSAQGTNDLCYGNTIWAGKGSDSIVELTMPSNGWFHSNARFIFNDLWNKDYNIFNEVLKYCKMYRIGIFVDDIAKKIKFIPLNKYFSGYTVTDWTEKLDKSKDYVIKPITFDNKYVLFNYIDSDTKLGKEYKEKYGVNYGEYRLVTAYNFNNDTTKLFDEVKGSITNTDNVLSWTNLYDYNKMVYSFPSELYVYNKDSDKKQVDLFGSYYFKIGCRDFSDESALHLRSVKISDDTALQQSTNKYFYTQMNDYSTSVTKYPNLDVYRNGNLCLYNIPMENYTFRDNYSGSTSIYEKVWKNYINERYSSRNKILTCYLRLTPQDYMNFDFNHFVRIENQLYMVNKIYDFDADNTESTKVDLITINNIQGYTTVN